MKVDEGVYRDTKASDSSELVELMAVFVDEGYDTHSVKKAAAAVLLAKTLPLGVKYPAELLNARNTVDATS